jgi:hypothetical protein
MIKMKKNSIFFTLVAIILTFPAFTVDALMIGRRRIQCSTPTGGKESDCLMDPRQNIPGIIAFVGAQATIPSLGKCPVENQFQPPWFLGNADAGGGLCPPEFWNAGALLPGLVILGGALVFNQYITSNRLLITDDGVGVVPSEVKKEERSDLTPFNDIENWFMTPVGLFLKLNSGSFKVFPLAWDQKSVEAVLEDRL